MKCPECGAVHNGMYKEIRQQIAEMGITKEDIKKAIDETIKSLVLSTISENAQAYIQKSVDHEIKGKLAWSRDTDRLIKETIKDVISDAIMDSLDIKVALRQPKEEEE